MNSATGEPLSGALVVAQVTSSFVAGQPTHPPEDRRAVTDASGRFLFEAKDAILATLQVSRQGYRSEENLDVARKVVRAADFGAILLRLVPQSVITGRVVDAEGEPLSGLTVEAVRIDIADGRRQLKENYARKAADDRGEYRLWDLPPGSYYLKVAGRAAMYNPAVKSMTFIYSDLAYGPMYYPSSPSQDTAQILRVEAGQTINASFTLEGRKAYQIRGQVMNAPPNRFLQSRLLRGGDPLANRAAVTVATDTFQVADVTPGTYTLQIYTADRGPIWFGETSVTAGEGNLTGVTLTMGPSVDVHGKIDFGGDIEGLPLIRLHRSDSTAPPNAASDVMATRDDDRAKFSFKGLLPGRYDVTVSGYFGEKYISSILAGTTDVLAEGLTVTAGGTPELSIALMPGGGTISGTISSANTPDQQWNLLLIGRSGLTETYKTEAAFGGQFQVSSLAPGEYALYAWPLARPLEFRNPPVLTTFSGFATYVTVGGGASTEPLTLKPIPTEAIP